MPRPVILCLILLKVASDLIAPRKSTCFPRRLEKPAGKIIIARANELAPAISAANLLAATDRRLIVTDYATLLRDLLTLNVRCIDRSFPARPRSPVADGRLRLGSSPPSTKFPYPPSARLPNSTANSTALLSASSSGRVASFSLNAARNPGAPTACRPKMRDHVPRDLYRWRALVESVFSAAKRKLSCRAPGRCLLPSVAKLVASPTISTACSA